MSWKREWGEGEGGDGTCQHIAFLRFVAFFLKEWAGEGVSATLAA
jgi:hypothetical protein